MNNKEGSWMFDWYNSDIWNSSEYYGTKEDAIEAAMSEDHRWNNKSEFRVGQITACDNDIYIDVENVIEQVADHLYDEIGEVAEYYLTYIKKKDREVLEVRMNATFKDWLKEFGYEPDFFKIINIETIKIDKN